MKAVSTLALVLLLPASVIAQGVDPTTAWNDFNTTQGSGWTVEWNAATGTPAAMYGPGLRLDGAVTTLKAARRESRALLNRYSSLLGKGESKFVETIGVKANKVYILVYSQEYKGLAVISGRADVRINDIGVVALFGAAAVKIENGFRTTPALSAAAGKAIAEGKILGRTAKARGLAAPRLVIWANTESAARTTATLAWEVQIDERTAGEVKVGKVYVDAAAGTILQWKDEVFYCGCGSTHIHKTNPAFSKRLNKAGKLADIAKATTAPNPAGAPLALTGKVMAWTNKGHKPLDAMTNVPMANLLVTSSAGSAFTDASGNFSIAYSGTSAVTVTATLTGRHSKRIRVAVGTQLSASTSVTPGTAATIQIGTSTMGELNRSQTTTYWFTDDCNTWFRSLLPGSTGPMSALSAMNPRVNIARSCNAFYTNFTINFYQSGTTCNMTAYETVVQHEWAHGADHAFGGISQIDGLSEGWGDTLATYRSAQPIVGPNFRKSGGFVRTALNTRKYPAGGTVHQQGQTWMGFNWDLRTNLMATHGSAAGVIIAEKIVIASIAADAKNQPAAVREVFILDDDDGNLNNGTPNYLDLEKAALKRTLPYPKKVNPNAGTYVTYGTGCKGSGKLSSSCRNANGSQTKLGTLVQNSNIFALLVPTSTTSTTVVGFELFTKAIGSPLTIKTQIYAATSTGAPTGSPIKTGTMTLGTTAGWYKTTFATPLVVAAGKKIFLSYTSVATKMSFPIMAAGTKVTHFWHPPTSSTWRGTPPNGYITQRWGWKLNCPTGPGAVPLLANNGVPEINTSFKIELSAAKPTTTTLLLIGVSDTTWSGTALPLDLSPFGATGCKLLTSLDAQVNGMTNSTGNFSQTFPVPNNPTLVGFIFFNQFVVADSFNTWGLVFSNGGKGKIGKK